MHILTVRELYEEKIAKRKDIRELLEDGYVKFVYFKENNERRLAFGTLKQDFIDLNFEYSDAPSNDPVRNSEKATDEMGYIKYYDLVKHNWRMFKVSNDVYYKESFDTLSELMEAYPKLAPKLSKYKVPKSEAKKDEPEDDSDGENNKD
jgi:hypothetical protein